MQFRNQIPPIIFRSPDPDPAGGGAPPVVPPVTPPEPVVAKPNDPPVAPPEPIVAPPEDSWEKKRIAELTFKLNKANEKLAKVTPPAAVTPPVGEAPEVFAARVDEAAAIKAAQIAQVESFNRQCNEVAELGKKEFPDFGEKLAGVQSVANLQDPVEAGQFNDFIATALETGHAHKLIHDLGSNPGEVRRLMALSPVKRAVEMAKRAEKLVSPAPTNPDPDPSGAPKPITPIASQGKHYDGIKPDDPVNGMKLTTAQWMKMREKQVEELGLQ